MVKKIIGITGDCYHNGAETDRYIQTVLDLLDEVVLFESLPLERLEEGILKRPDLIILSIENRRTPDQDNLNEWLTPEFNTMITDYVNHGGSWLALHSGMSNYPLDSDYIQMLKGYFVLHPKPLAVTYRSDLPDSPQEFMMVDEHYQVALVDEFTTVFLRSYSDFGKSVAGWRHFYGSGKVAGYVPAHNYESMLDSRNLALMTLVVKWLLKHQSSVRWKQYL